MPSSRLEEGRDAAVRGDLVCARGLLSDENAVSDLAVLEAAEGRTDAAISAFENEPQDVSSRENLRFLLDHLDPTQAERPYRIAVLSLLFNWPSTGGGTVHTFELLKFLAAAGVTVRHIYAVYQPWEIGGVEETLPYPAKAIEFREAAWHQKSIRRRFGEELEGFVPDAVIVTDSWNTKPLLAEAAGDAPYFLRLAAQETVCPLNNVRLLFHNGEFQQCEDNQLAEPDVCRTCVSQNRSGSLHEAERQLSGFHEPDYAARLKSAYRNAAGVLAVNPEIAELARPFADTVEVLPSGFDRDRFDGPQTSRPQGPPRLLFAGLPEEAMKGFFVLRQAAEILLSRGEDFELLVTADAPRDGARPYERYVGWQSQADLPRLMQDADIVVVPTIAQEALGRTAVEAMGAGKPVVASNIGGLPWVIEHEQQGLICPPGDAASLADALSRLCTDPDLRVRLGRSGRSKFEKEFLWEHLIETRYLPLFQMAVRSRRSAL